MRGEIFHGLRQALKQSDTKLVEDEIRKLALNAEAAHLNELTKAKLWLASKAILGNNLALAKEMYQPFDSLLPLQQTLILPDLSEADLEKAVALAADWPELSLSLAYHYWRKGAFAKAKPILAKLTAKPDDGKFGHTVLELYCDSLSRLGGTANLNEIKAICQPITTPGQQYRYPFLYLGSATFIKRLTAPQKNNLFKRLLKEKTANDALLAEAIALFKEAAQRPQGLVHISCGSLSVVEPGSIALDGSAASQLAIEAISLDQANDYQTSNQAVIFFACDSVYLRQFALLLVASIARLNNNVLCHVHIVDPSEDSPEIVAEIRNLVPQVRINVSSERLNSPQKKPYYASARFIRAIELLDLYQAPLFIVDTDMVIEMSTEKLMQLTEGYDVGLIIRTGSAPFPWTEVQAGTAYFTNSQNSRRFLELTKQAILSKLYEPNAEQLWYVDQNALFSVYWLMRNELTVCNLLSPPQKPIYSCYSRTVNRQQFTAMKLAEFGIRQPLPKTTPAAVTVTNKSANNQAADAALALAETIAAATKWFEKEGDSEIARQEAAKILPQWQRMRRLFVKHGFIAK